MIFFRINSLRKCIFNKGFRNLRLILLRNYYFRAILRTPPFFLHYHREFITVKSEYTHYYFIQLKQWLMPS